MGIVKATKTGVWSDSSVWSPAPPTSADDVYSNTFTVTIDTSPTVLSIQNVSATGVTAGGSFVPTNGITLSGNIIGSSAVNPGAPTLTVSLTTGQSCSVIGNVSGSINQPGITLSGSGTVNITGNCTGGGGSAGNGVRVTGSGTANITGICTGGFNSLGHGAEVASSGTLNITGTCQGSPTNTGAYGGQNSGSGTLNHTGSCNGTVAYGIANISTGIVTISGAITAGSGLPGFNSTNISGQSILTGPFITASNGVQPVYSVNWKWLNVNPPATYYQIRSANNAVIRPLYTADSVGGNPAASNVRSGTVYGPNNELTGTCAVPGASSVVVGVAVDNTVGTAAVTAASIRAAIGLASANLDTQLAAIPTTAAPTAAAIRTEMDANSTKLANLDATVSSRSTYAGADTSGTTTLLSRLTATRAGYLDNISSAAPSASTIASAVWAVATSALSSAGTIGKLIVDNLNATISSRSTYDGSDTTGTTTLLSRLTATRAGNLDSLDATISSRLATSGYTAPPSASTVASAVWAAASRTLTAAIDQSASIASAVWTYGSGRNVDRVTLTDTATTLTNAPTVPSASTIAQTVWGQAASGLTTAGTIGAQLATNLDQPVSTRLAAASYTAPPSTSAIRTELSVELARIDQPISTRSTYSGADTAGTTTLLGRLTSGRASNLDLLDVALSSRLAASAYTTPPTVAAIVAAIDKTGYSLTDAERQAISTVVQQGILNENDGQQVLNAIVGAIGNQNVDQVALVAAIRADLERSGGTLATRLAASAYTAPPSSATVASSVRSELSTELARIDQPVSSRLASSAYTTPPTAAAVASATRSELAIEMSRLDVAVSSRPSAADVAAAVWAYSGGRLLSSVSAIVSGVWSYASGRNVDSVTTLVNTPDVPSVSQISAGVRQELAPELARAANTATTQEVAEIVQDAFGQP